MSREEIPDPCNPPHDEPPSQAETRDLLERVRRGDFSALGPVVERVNPWLERTAVLRLRRLPPVLAEPADLVQEAWARTLKALPRLTPHDGNLVPTVVKYATKTIRTRARDLMKRHVRWSEGGLRRENFGETALGELPHATRGIVTRAIASERQDQVREAIGSLPENDQEILVLCGIEQNPHHETAHALGISPESVRQRYSRAKGRLRERLAHSLLDEIDPS